MEPQNSRWAPSPLKQMVIKSGKRPCLSCRKSGYRLIAQLVQAQRFRL
jgi:hypothetical protein